MFEPQPARVRGNSSPSYMPAALRFGHHETGTFEGIQVGESGRRALSNNSTQSQNYCCTVVVLAFRF